MHIPPARSVLVTSCLVLALAGCASDPSRFSHGQLIAACGPSGGRATSFQLAVDAVPCTSANMQPTRLSVYAEGELGEGGTLDVSTAYSAERCVDDACVELTHGTIELLQRDGDRAEVRWSIELADGQLDEGQAWIASCDREPAICL